MQSEKLIQKWTKEFSWISFSDHKAYCECCKVANPLSVFSSGTVSLKNSHFKDNEENLGHMKSEKAYHQKKIQARIKVITRNLNRS
jgi:hypothetical protein